MCLLARRIGFLILFVVLYLGGMCCLIEQEIQNFLITNPRNPQQVQKFIKPVNRQQHLRLIMLMGLLLIKQKIIQFVLLLLIELRLEAFLLLVICMIFGCPEKPLILVLLIDSIDLSFDIHYFLLMIIVR